MTETRTLDSPPSLRTLYPRAVVGAARSALGRLPGLGPSDSAALPDLGLELDGVEIDRDHLAAYDRVCGFRLRDELPVTYPHVLAFPLSMRLMTDPSFPFAVVGLVHVENHIDQRRALRADERLDLRVWLRGPRPHERGTEFDVMAMVSVGGEPVWESASTYLRKERSGGGRSSSGGRNGGAPRPGAIWDVPADIGRSYAAVSGDRNPIHLHSLSARLFGMPRPIAHGMWLKARCVAALEGVVPDRCQVDVRFKLPVPLPTKVRFASWPSNGGRAFSLHDADGERPHLTGGVRPALH